MAKTIRQIADELGVSKTAVHKKIANLGLRSSLQKNGNQFTIDEHQEKLIKSAFTGESQTESQTVCVLITILQKELEIKNKQISDLNDRLAECQKLLDQYQKLSAMEKVVQKIEMENSPEKEEESLTPSSAEPETRKKAWWKFWEN